jgi:hypothetical protein
MPIVITIDRQPGDLLAYEPDPDDLLPNDESDE